MKMTSSVLLLVGVLGTVYATEEFSGSATEYFPKTIPCKLGYISSIVAIPASLFGIHLIA